jgi:hypothetical protein
MLSSSANAVSGGLLTVSGAADPSVSGGTIATAVSATSSAGSSSIEDGITAALKPVMMDTIVSDTLLFGALLCGINGGVAMLMAEDLLP